jgi:Ni/Co efflux regulator RcnB
MKTETGATLALAGVLSMMIACTPFAANAGEVAGGVIGCDAPGGKQEVGAVIGAVLGGVAGNDLARHNRGAGTVLGATAGAAAGSYVGCNMQKNRASTAPRSDAGSRARPVEDDEPVDVERSSYPREQRFTPPGLARKPYGMPPGQAKKYYGVGERMPVSYVREPRYYVEEPRAYGLPHAPVGYRWILVDRDAYLVRSRSGVIRDVIRAVLD